MTRLPRRFRIGSEDEALVSVEGVVFTDGSVALRQVGGVPLAMSVPSLEHVRRAFGVIEFVDAPDGQPLVTP